MSEISEFSWRRVWELFRPHRRRVSLVFVLVVVASAIGVANPLLLQVVFDNALFPSGAAEPNMALLIALVGLMTLIAIVAGVLGVWQTVVTNRLGQQVLRDLRDRVYRHLHTLSLSFYASSRTGDLQSRLSNDVGGVQTAVTTSLSSMLSNAVTFIAAVIAMFALSWQLALVALAFIPIFVGATRIIARRREAYTGEMQVAVADMNILTQETLSVSGFTLARLFGQKEREIERFGDANLRLASAASRQQVIGQSFFTVVQAFLGLAPIVIYLVAGLLINGGSDLSAGTIVAFTTLQTRLFFPVARMLEVYVEFQSSRAMFRRVFEYLDAEPDIVERHKPAELDPAATDGLLVFDDVHFEYPVETEEPVTALDGVAFEAASGQLVAFVGPSGAGKSTILSLAARLYDPDTGSVGIDGIDLRDLSLDSLAENIGVVTQESYLFHDTLRANIAYGKPNASDEDVIAAAQAADIHERIVSFDDGYQTLVGERGFRLSGGERQRVAIARVILHDPRILLLDEATSALDSGAERRIQAALANLVAGRTTIAVAHRLSTIEAADVIHVVEQGRIVESGSHDTLLERGGAYRRLYHDQYGDGSIETRCADGVVRADGRLEPFATVGAAAGATDLDVTARRRSLRQRERNRRR